MKFGIQIEVTAAGRPEWIGAHNEYLWLCEVPSNKGTVKVLGFYRSGKSFRRWMLAKHIYSAKVGEVADDTPEILMVSSPAEAEAIIKQQLPNRKAFD